MSHLNVRRQRAQRRRTKRVAASGSDLTTEQWRLIREAWRGCAYCGKEDGPFQKDCVQPIAWGGRYALDNVVPACRSCNASKNNEEVTSWMRRRKLDEQAFLVRWYRINADLSAANERP